MTDEAVRACALLVANRQRERRLASVSAGVFRGADLLAYAGAGAEPPTADTQYRIGSITKTFTAVLVMQLRDAGLLDLDDPIVRHLPETAHGDATVRRLLAHLSGLQREPVGEVWEHLVAPERDALLDNVARAERVLPPGRRWHYSNLAYAVLGELVARLTKGTWEDALQARLLDPLGLSRTTTAEREPYARGYFTDPYADRLHPEPDFRMGAVASAAVLWSTVDDLRGWGAFLAEPDPKVLAPSTLDEMAHLHGMADLDGWTLGWGLGLMLFRRGERVFAGHTGGMPGHLAVLAVDRKSKTGAVALTNNTSNADIGGLGLDLLTTWLDLAPVEEPPWAPGDPVPPEVEPLLGPWWTEGTEFTFRWRRGRLEAVPAAMPAGPPAVFAPEGADTYRGTEGREQGELLRAVRDPSGAVVKMYWATYPLTRVPLPFGAS